MPIPYEVISSSGSRRTATSTSSRRNLSDKKKVLPSMRCCNIDQPYEQETHRCCDDCKSIDFDQYQHRRSKDNSASHSYEEYPKSSVPDSLDEEDYGSIYSSHTRPARSILPGSSNGSPHLKYSPPVLNTDIPMARDYDEEPYSPGYAPYVPIQTRSTWAPLEAAYNSLLEYSEIESPEVHRSGHDSAIDIRDPSYLAKHDIWHTGAWARPYSEPF